MRERRKKKEKSVCCYLSFFPFKVLLSISLPRTHVPSQTFFYLVIPRFNEGHPSPRPPGQLCLFAYRRASNKAAAVDPFDVPRVAAAAERLGVSIIAAITTHHHNDHSGGNGVCV